MPTTGMEKALRALQRGGCDSEDEEQISVTEDSPCEQPAIIGNPINNHHHSSTNSPPSSTTSPVTAAVLEEGAGGPQPLEPMAAMGLLNLFANGYGGSSALNFPSLHNNITTPTSAEGKANLMHGGIESTPVKRRRRMVGNMDNTLDGLVAKKAADEVPAAIGKRYQTEVEAIELPDDEVEIQRMEADPDVSTRQCSVCGYQGKWVSEMIRHKRVHTHERPFKCKFCNRTSKWKADLIRHVAKTHGIRVVSKYSRSKAFEAVNGSGGGGHRPSGGAGSEKSKTNSPNSISRSNSSTSSSPTTIPSSNSTSSVIRKANNTQSESNTTVYRCVICLFEAGGGDQNGSSLSLMRAHLRNVHNLPPLQCIQCASCFDDVDSASRHCSERAPGGGVCSPLAIKLNFAIANPTGNNGQQPASEPSEEPLRVDIGARSIQPQPQQQLPAPLANFSYAAVLTAVMQREQLKSQLMAGGFGGGVQTCTAPALANLWANSMGGLLGGANGAGAMQPPVSAATMGMPAWIQGWQQQWALASAAAAMAARHQQLQGASNE